MAEQKSYYAIIPANVRYDKDLTPNAKLLYGEITALCNERGYCWSENSYFAELYGVSNTSISKWINLLVQKGYLSSEITYKEGTKQIDKRYLRIVAYPIEEKFNTPIEEKLKGNNTGVNNTSNNTIIKKKLQRKVEDYETEFEEIWAIYPRKELKSLGLKHYISARKNGVTYEEIKGGVERYVAHCKIKETDKDYITKGGNFFYKKLWSDDFDMTPKTQTPTKTYGANGIAIKPDSELSEGDRAFSEWWDKNVEGNNG